MKIRNKFVFMLIGVTLITCLGFIGVMLVFGEMSPQIMRGLIGVMFVSCVIAIIAALFASNMVIVPLKNLLRQIQSISDGDLKTSISINRNDEFGELALHLDRMRQNLHQSRKELEKLNMELETRISERTMELELRTMELHTKSIRLDEEMDRGRMVQVSMMPTMFPEVDGWEFYGASIAAEEIGGDYFDFIEYADGQLGAVIADVSGKGIPAAMIMAMVKSGLYAQIPFEPTPQTMLQSVNRIICTASSAKRLLTLFYSTINLQTGKMIYASAGHPYPFVIRESASEVELTQLTTTSFPMGVQENLTFLSHDYQLQPQETLVLYNSGIVNAMNAKSAMFGFERFEKLLRKHHHLSASEIINEVFESLSGFCANTLQKDDMTIVVIKRI